MHQLTQDTFWTVLLVCCFITLWQIIGSVRADARSNFTNIMRAKHQQDRFKIALEILKCMIPLIDGLENTANRTTSAVRRLGDKMLDTTREDAQQLNERL